jgi:serine protease Do
MGMATHGGSPRRMLLTVALCATATAFGSSPTSRPVAALGDLGGAAAGATLAPGSAPDYRAIVRQSGPAVVGVTVAGLMKRGTGGPSPDFEEDPFFQFFRGLPGFQRRQPGAEVPFRGQGSGFIISSDGLVLTNAHVVRDAKEVTVKLSDRREIKARVLGADATTDIAVLRVDARNLPIVRLGDVQQLQVGDPVLAIGSPFGFEQTVTHGIVSAKGRSLPGDTSVPFIQTDAAVNPGNSGGPLFDGSGAVVGINAQIFSQSGGYQGLAFAIPINVALKVKDQIVAKGRASHARLGVSVQDVDQGLADSFGLERPEGALVSEIVADSAAALAGLKPGDIITAVNGETIVRSGDLSSRIALASPGDVLHLRVWRDKTALEVAAKLGRAEDDAAGAVDTLPAPPPGELGLQLRALTPPERAQVRVDGGLVVESVSGAAARAGLLPGDLVLGVDGVRVRSVDEVRKLLDRRPRSVALLIERDGRRLFVPVALR